MASQNPSGRFLCPETDEFIKRVMEEFHVPGASVAVVFENEIECKGYGVVEMQGSGVTADTVFNAGSMFKSFTAAAVGLLVQDDSYPNVQWDTPVSTLMRDDFVLSDPYLTENVTAVDMLTHRTGIPGHDSSLYGTRASNPDTPKSATRKLRHFPSNKPFRTSCQYNNMMFIASSYLVEQITGVSFNDFLRSRFWGPLSMTRTFAATSDTVAGRDPASAIGSSEKTFDVAMPHHWDAKSQSYVKLRYFIGPEGQGAGNILTTSGDFARWIQSMIYHNNGLSADTIAYLTAPHILNSSRDEELTSGRHSPIFRGMGWQVEYYRGYKSVSHGGQVPGFTCLARYLPEKKFGVVVLGNSMGAYLAAEAICWKLINSFLCVPQEERVDWVARMKRFQNDESDDERDSEGVYTNLPTPLLPLPLPLAQFAGNYAHPAYGELVLELQETDSLVCNCSTRTFGFWLKFKHASGLFFTAVVEYDDVWSDLGRDKVRAEFKVSAQGQIVELGVDFAGTDLVWFKRR